MKQSFEQSSIESDSSRLEKSVDFDELRSLIVEAIRKDHISVADAIVDFDERLKTKYGDDVRKYRLWHLMVGSTPDPDKTMIETDFAGEDSIEQFIRNL